MRMSIISLGVAALHGMIEAEKHSEVHTTAIHHPTESKDLFLYLGVTQSPSSTKLSHRSHICHIESLLHSGVTQAPPPLR